SLLFLLDVRDEMRHGLLHHAGALDDLGQEHLPGAEEVSDHVHSVHERAFDHAQRTRVLLPRLFDVIHHVLDDALHERMLESLLDGLAAPCGGFRLRLLAAVRVLLGELDEPLRSIVAAIQEHVLHALEQLIRTLVVHLDLTRVYDAHVHPGADGVVQKRRVHGLPHGIVPAKGEAQIAHTAAHLRQRQVLLDPAGGLDEIDRIRVVLRDAGRHGEDVRVEDDILRRKADVIHQNPIGALANRLSPLKRVGLPLFVECHHDDGRAEPPHDAGLITEDGLALLKTDGVYNALPLNALQPRLDHGPSRRIDHYGDFRDVGFGGDEVQKSHHRLLGIEHPLVHVHVDELRAVLDLLQGDGEGFLVIVLLDQAGEALGARDVRALADVHEVGFGPDDERLQTTQPQIRLLVEDAARPMPLGGVGDRADVLRGRPATASYDVHEALPREFVELFGHELGRLVVAAEFVGKAGIRVQARVDRRRAGELLDERSHLFGAERTVKTYAQQVLHVRDGDPEGLRSLAGQRAATLVDD